MGWYTFGLGMLAGLNHSHADLRNKSLTFLQLCNKALTATMVSGTLTLSQLAAAQALGSPLVKVIRMASVGAKDAESLSAAAEEVLTSMCRGMFHDKVMEDNLKEMREAEKRDSSA